VAEKVNKVGAEEGDMKEENGNTEDDLLELMGKYHQGYSTETQLLQTYRMICLAFQAILFAGAFALHLVYEEKGMMQVVLMTGVTAVGLLFLFMWIFVCTKRSIRAEKWRDEITDLTTTKNSPEDKFKVLCKEEESLSRMRTGFNFLMPVFLSLGWVSLYCGYIMGVKMFVGIFCSEQLMLVGLICTTIGSIFLGVWSYFCLRIRKGKLQICDNKICEYFDRIVKPIGFVLFCFGFILQILGYLTL
jgi:hypothetical protein